VEPTYNCSNATYDPLIRPDEGTYWGLDSFPAVYDSETGDSVFIEPASGSNGWQIVERKEIYGAPQIGTNTITYFINSNDGKLYQFLTAGGDGPTKIYGDLNISYVVQDINYNPAELGLKGSLTTDSRFYLYHCDPVTPQAVTDRYPYVYMNSYGYCQSNSRIYTTVAFSQDKQKWDLYDYNGKLIVSGLEPFQCNIYDNVWWTPASMFIDDATPMIFGEASPFCATEGYIAAKINGQCGYLDICGNTVIDFGILEDVRPVHYGEAWAKYNGKWGVLSFSDAS